MPVTRNPKEALIKARIEYAVTSGRGYSSQVDILFFSRRKSSIKTQELRDFLNALDRVNARGFIDPIRHPIIPPINDSDQRPFYFY